jgi:hypothetical protein
MNRSSAHEQFGPMTMHLDREPVSVRLPAGAAIFAVRGEAWITQEGMFDDVVLGPGQRFDVSTGEQLVISATRGTADLFIARPLYARRLPVADVHDFARCRAARLRREEIAQFSSALVDAARALAARLRAVFAGHARAPTH